MEIVVVAYLTDVFTLDILRILCVFVVDTFVCRIPREQAHEAGVKTITQSVRCEPD